MEIGRITDEKMVIKWDGIKRRVEDWNKDLTMEEAFKVPLKVTLAKEEAPFTVKEPEVVMLLPMEVLAPDTR